MYEYVGGLPQVNSLTQGLKSILNRALLSMCHLASTRGQLAKSKDSALSWVSLQASKSSKKKIINTKKKKEVLYSSFVYKEKRKIEILE